VPSNATAPGKLVKSFLSTGSLGLSRSVSRVQALLQSPQYNAADLAEQMRTDPTLTARVMAVANSAFFHKTPCDNITDAVNRLGTAQLTYIFGQVLAGAVLVTPLQGYGLSSQKIWQRAVITGVGAEFAAGRSGEDRSLAYLVGLLHEIGMLVVDRCWSQLADRRPLRYADFATEYSLDEQQLLSCHQADCGGELLKQLSFPDSVCRQVRQQYRAPQEPMARALYLGRLAKATHSAEFPPAPDLEVLALCGFSSRRKLEGYIAEVITEAQKRINGNRAGSRSNDAWR